MARTFTNRIVNSLVGVALWGSLVAIWSHLPWVLRKYELLGELAIAYTIPAFWLGILFLHFAFIGEKVSAERAEQVIMGSFTMTMLLFYFSAVLVVLPAGLCLALAMTVANMLKTFSLWPWIFVPLVTVWLWLGWHLMGKSMYEDWRSTDAADTGSNEVAEGADRE